MQDYEKESIVRREELGGGKKTHHEKEREKELHRELKVTFDRIFRIFIGIIRTSIGVRCFFFN